MRIESSGLLDGLLLIDKPMGITSFDVVRRVRRRLRVKKVGHLGTLDPFATGLLPLCLGEATRLTPFLLEESKTYAARLKLGEETDTLDLTGKVLTRCDQLPTAEDVYAAAPQFLGEIEQTPPMYSALRHQGVRLYRLARQGERVAVPPRKVVIHQLEVEEVALPEVMIRVTCSKGTYIRTLAADLGQALGCGAHLTALRRLAVGHFRVEEALPLSKVDEEGCFPEVLGRIIPLSQCLPGMRPLPAGPGELRCLQQGQAVPCPENGLEPGEHIRVLDGENLAAVALVRHRGDQKMLAPVRVFARR